MADVRTTATGSASWHGGFLDSVAHGMTPDRRLVSLCTWLSHRSSHSTVEEDMVLPS